MSVVALIIVICWTLERFSENSRNKEIYEFIVNFGLFVVVVEHLTRL